MEAVCTMSRAMTIVICMNNLTAKDDYQLVLQVTIHVYFANQCEAMFSTERLKIFKGS